MEEVTHTEIYTRLVEVEKKVDKVARDTESVVDAFEAARGAFTVLEWLAKVAKPLLWIIGLSAAIATLFQNYPKK
jgi:hypothetical protein